MKEEIEFTGGTKKQKAYAIALLQKGAKALAGTNPTEREKHKEYKRCVAWLQEKCGKGEKYDEAKIWQILQEQVKKWHAGNIITETKNKEAEGVERLLRFAWAEERSAEIAAGINTAPLESGKIEEWQGTVRGKEVRMRAHVEEAAYMSNSTQYRKGLLFITEKFKDGEWKKEREIIIGCGPGKVTRSTYPEREKRRAGEYMEQFKDSGAQEIMSDWLLQKHEYRNRASRDWKEQDAIAEAEATKEKIRNTEEE